MSASGKYIQLKGWGLGKHVHLKGWGLGGCTFKGVVIGGSMYS